MRRSFSLYSLCEEDRRVTQLIREHGLAVYPGAVLFLESFVGEEYKSKITFRNISVHKLAMKMKKPSRSYFDLNDDGSTIVLAPGLSIIREITFKCVSQEVSDSHFQICIDEETFEIPIRVKLGQPCLVVSPLKINYGMINLGAGFITKYLHLMNTGTATCPYRIDFGLNILDLDARPRSGSVPPKSTLTIKLDLTTFVPGHHFSKFWIKSTPPALVEVEVQVLAPLLKPVHANTTARFTLIDFAPTYYRTSRHETLIVKNISATPAPFVILAEVNNTLMSVEEIFASGDEKAALFQNFSVQPREGIIGPFESRIFTLWFHPVLITPDKGWMQNQSMEEEYLCFFKILRVDARSESLKPEFEDDDEDSVNVRLGLHGCGLRPKLSLLTSSFCFPDLELGQPVKRVIELKNNGILPIFLSYVKVPGFAVKPASLQVPQQKHVQLVLEVKVNSLANPPKFIAFDVMGYEDCTEQRGKAVIGQLKIPLKINVVSTAKTLKPDFVTGITPKIAHEVGVHTELVRFCDRVDLPKMMLIPDRPDPKRPWLQGEDHIAFPNDMPRSAQRVKPTDKLMRTIFTGKKRYVPPIDKSLTYSPSEAKIKQEWKDYYRNFIDEQYYEKLKYFLSEDEKYIIWENTVAEKQWYKNVSMKSIMHKKKYIKKPQVQVEMKEAFPLTPKDLYKIEIIPKILDFGQVPVNVDCSRSLTIENKNSFPVVVNIHVQKDTTGNNDELIVVKPGEKVKKFITLNLNNYGKYFSNVTFMINDSDFFDITVTADVVIMSLSIVPKEVVISQKADDLFQLLWSPVKLVNSLYVPTSFEWRVPPDCPYRIEPLSGTVPGQRNIVCALYHEPCKGPSSPTYLTLYVIGGDPVEMSVTRLHEKAYGVVALWQKKMLPPLSCSFLYNDNAYLFNTGFRDAAFQVMQPQPLEGVNITPVSGVLRGRSCLVLNVEFNVNSVQAFEFAITTKFHAKSYVEVKFVGFVYFPKISFTPEVIELRNIPCFSLVSSVIVVENYGETQAAVHFEMEGYPQLKISESKKALHPGLDEYDSIIMYPGTTKELYLHLMPFNYATYEFFLPVVLNRKIGPPEISEEHSQMALSYVSSAAHQNKIMRRVDLSFPLKLSTITIDVCIGRGFIEFSALKMDFFCNAHSSCFKLLKMTNVSKEPCVVSYDPKVFPSLCPFSLKDGPKDGTYRILPEDEVFLHFEFTPKESSEHVEIEIPFYVHEVSSTVPYNIIHLYGNVLKPTLSLADPIVHFVTVPLGVISERYIEIEAKHHAEPCRLYASVQKIIGLNDDFLIDFFYPKGNSIPPYFVKPHVIPVIMKFRSKRFLDQRGVISFYDDFDGMCSLYYTACSDNSVLSCYNYLFAIESIRSMSVYERSSRKMTKNIMKLIGTDELPNLNIKEFSESVYHEFNEQLWEFPMFPVMEDCPYTAAIENIVNIMETWVFEQGLSGSFRMKLGEQLSYNRTFVSGQNSRSKSSHQSNIKSIVDVLYSFIGRDLLLEYNIPSYIPEGNNERIEYCLNVYKQILKFLRVQGGTVSHIFPVYLLEYDDYVDHLNEKLNKTGEFKKKSFQFDEHFEEVCSKKILLPYDEYIRFHKQGWLDVLLQIHRTVIQSGIPYFKELSKCHSDVKSEGYDLSVRSRTSVEKVVDLHGLSTIWEKGNQILVDWLNLTSKVTSLKYPQLGIARHHVEDIYGDLEDCVTLAATTLYYCPYLIDTYFSDFFFDPSDRNQIHHNATQLCIAWYDIKLGISVRPENLYHSNPVFNTILVCHLYQFLRSYVPQKTIEFVAPLTVSVTRTITVTNPHDRSIGYSLKILNDVSKMFEVAMGRSSIVIAPRCLIKIAITFSAKKLTSTSATLLLCGSCLPNGFVQNIVLKLHGEPHVLTISKEYNIITPIMRPNYVISNVISPYEEEAEFEIWYSAVEPKPGSVLMRPWSELKLSKVPRSLFLSNDRLLVPPYGSSIAAPFAFTAAAYTRAVLHYWLIFRNESVGDFIIKLSLFPKVETPSLILRVPLPSGRCTGYPGTLCSARCPRLIKVHIPSRNTRLWATVKTMLNLTLNPKEYSFWENHFESQIGLDLMKMLVQKYDKLIANQINFIFESKVLYKITSLSPHVHLQETVEVEDVHSKEFVTIQAHLCCRISSEYCSDILLEGSNGDEVRLYRLRFWGPEDEVAADEIYFCKKGCNLHLELDGLPCSPNPASKENTKKRFLSRRKLK